MRCGSRSGAGMKAHIGGFVHQRLAVHAELVVRVAEQMIERRLRHCSMARVPPSMNMRQVARHQGRRQ